MANFAPPRIRPCIEQFVSLCNPQRKTQFLCFSLALRKFMYVLELLQVGIA
jgi:hypothetical protein